MAKCAVCARKLLAEKITSEDAEMYLFAGMMPSVVWITYEECCESGSVSLPHSRETILQYWIGGRRFLTDEPQP